MNGRARHAGLNPVRGLEQLTGGVRGAARDLPPHPHPGTEIEPAIVAAGHLERWGFALVRVGHGGPFLEAPGSRLPLELRAGSSASVEQPMPSAPSMRLPHSPVTGTSTRRGASAPLRDKEQAASGTLPIALPARRRGAPARCAPAARAGCPSPGPSEPSAAQPCRACPPAPGSARSRIAAGPAPRGALCTDA